MVHNCGTCAKAVKKSDASMQCDGFCALWYHTTCVDISSQDYDFLKEMEVEVYWYCTDCDKKVKDIIKEGKKIKKLTGTDNFFVGISSKLDKVIDSVTRIIKENREVHIPNKIMEVKSYASIAKSAVILHPKQKQAAEVTEKELKQKINPNGLKINEVKKLKSGAVIVKCEDEQSSNKLIEDAKEKMKDNYEVKNNESKLPRVKISNISQDYDEQKLIDVLKKQNKSLKDAKVKVRTIWKNKTVFSRERYTAILELDTKSFNEVVKDGVVWVDWDRCAVSESIHVKRCYKCLGFDHNSDDCKESKICSKCGESHSQDCQYGKNCEAIKECCVNCMKVNKERGLNLDTEHHAFDRNCGVFQRKLNIIRNRIWN